MCNTYGHKTDRIKGSFPFSGGERGVLNAEVFRAMNCTIYHNVICNHVLKEPFINYVVSVRGREVAPQTIYPD